MRRHEPQHQPATPCGCPTSENKFCAGWLRRALSGLCRGLAVFSRMGNHKMSPSARSLYCITLHVLEEVNHFTPQVRSYLIPSPAAVCSRADSEIDKGKLTSIWPLSSTSERSHCRVVGLGNMSAIRQHNDDGSWKSGCSADKIHPALPLHAETNNSLTWMLSRTARNAERGTTRFSVCSWKCSSVRNCTERRQLWPERRQAKLDSSTN